MNWLSRTWQNLRKNYHAVLMSIATPEDHTTPPAQRYPTRSNGPVSRRCEACKGRAHPGNPWKLTCAPCQNRGVLLPWRGK